MQRLACIVIPDGERRPGSAGRRNRRNTDKRQIQTTGQRFSGVEQCSSAHANHHAAILSRLFCQLSNIGFAAMSRKQQALSLGEMKCLWQIRAGRIDSALTINPYGA